jgi:GT2 family glycosyltransferase
MITSIQLGDRVGIVGPRLVYGDGRFQRWTGGRLPSLSSMLTFALVLDRVMPTAGPWIGRDVSTPFQPEWVSTACMLVRRQLFEEVGLLEEHFLYMEDVDLCERATRAGWQVWYEPRATAIHLMGQSSERVTGQTSPWAIRSFVRFYRDRHGTTATLALRAVFALGFLVRGAMYAVASVRQRQQRSAARAHFRNARLALSSTGRTTS